MINSLWAYNYKYNNTRLCRSIVLYNLYVDLLYYKSLIMNKKHDNKRANLNNHKET